MLLPLIVGVQGSNWSYGEFLGNIVMELPTEVTEGEGVEQDNDYEGGELRRHAVNTGGNSSAYYFSQSALESYYG